MEENIEKFMQGIKVVVDEPVVLDLIINPEDMARYEEHRIAEIFYLDKFIGYAYLKNWIEGLFLVFAFKGIKQNISVPVSKYFIKFLNLDVNIRERLFWDKKQLQPVVYALTNIPVEFLPTAIV
jgi:hypothetical protein